MAKEKSFTYYQKKNKNKIIIESLALFSKLTNTTYHNRIAMLLFDIKLIYRFDYWQSRVD